MNKERKLWMSELKKGAKNEWVSEGMNEWINEWIN